MARWPLILTRKNKMPSRYRARLKLVLRSRGFERELYTMKASTVISKASWRPFEPEDNKKQHPRDYLPE